MTIQEISKPSSYYLGLTKKGPALMFSNSDIAGQPQARGAGDYCYICSKLIWHPAEAVEADVPGGDKVLICSSHAYAELKRKLEQEKSERD